MAAGYEDLNGHDALRHDLAWQTAVERDKPPAGSPTLCRLENRADRETAVAINPGDASAYNNRGLAYEYLKQFRRAIEDFGRAIELDPGLAPAYGNRGATYYGFGQSGIGAAGTGARPVTSGSPAPANS